MSGTASTSVNARKKKAGIIKYLKKKFSREGELWIIAILMLIWVAIFAYYPMFGLIIAFKKYVPGKSFTEGAWVGFEYFKQFVSNPEFGMVLRNTLAISGLQMLFGFPAPIIFAIILNEVRARRFKKFVQTVSYLPHFVSWVVTASIAFSILNYDGVFNDLMMLLGIIDEPVSWLGEGKYFWGVITVANIWKSVGWSSIIYLSAIAGIDEELYQAGAVDGLGRFGMIWHITLPSIRTTVVLMWILAIGGILNAGFEQQLLLGNEKTRTFYEVIDTYAYKYGVQQGRFSYGTAVGLLKGVISVSLVFITNRISKKLLDVSVL